jgi:hypothetical protein
MAQQSNTESRGTANPLQGNKTREQQRANNASDGHLKGVDVDPHQPSIAEARAAAETPATQYDNSTGDRSIQRGANQESEHRKRRSE